MTTGIVMIGLAVILMVFLSNSMLKDLSLEQMRILLDESYDEMEQNHDK